MIPEEAFGDECLWLSGQRGQTKCLRMKRALARAAVAAYGRAASMMSDSASTRNCGVDDHLQATAHQRILVLKPKAFAVGRGANTVKCSLSA